MNRKDKVVIFGAGGHGKVILDILLESKANIAGFIDDDEKKTGQTIHGFEILGNWSYLRNKKSIKIALGIGNNKIRENIFKKAKSKGIKLYSAIHPKAVVSRQTKLGEGVVIMAGAVVNPGSILEDGVVVNTGATIDHDCCLKRFSHIWPGAHLAGTVHVGEFSYVGTGASVIQNIKIGSKVMVGAGAVVISNIPDGVTAVGVPAKIIKKNNDEK